MAKRRWILRIGAVLFSIALVAFLFLLWLAKSWRNIPLGRSTTYLTTPLAPDGLPDYLVALNAENGARVTVENNAALPMLAILNPEHNAPAWWAAETHLIAIPPLTTTHWIYLDDSWTAYSATAPTTQPPSAQSERQDDEYAASTATLSNLWSPREFPAIASYLRVNNSALDELEKLTTRGHFFIPFVTGAGDATTTNRPAMLQLHLPLGIFREAANAMLQRGLLRTQQGDAAGAVEDLLAAVRIAHLMNQQHSLLDYLVATAIEQAAMVAIQRVVAADKLPAAEAGGLEQQLATFPEWPAPIEALNHFERYTTLDSFSAVLDTVRGGPAPRGPTLPFAGIPIHFEAAFIDANHFTDRQCDAFRQPHYADREAQLTAINVDLDDLGRRGIAYKVTHAYGVLLLMMNVSMTGVDKNMTMTLADERLARTALALRRYHAAHGHFPAALAELPEPPAADPFTDANLLLKATPTSYVLYSVGPDLADDGGKPPRNIHQRTGFDVVVSCTLVSPATQP